MLLRKQDLKKRLLQLLSNCFRTPENVNSKEGLVLIHCFNLWSRDSMCWDCGELGHHSNGHPGRELFTSQKQEGEGIERKVLGTCNALQRYTSSDLLPSTDSPTNSPFSYEFINRRISELRWNPHDLMTSLKLFHTRAFREPF